MSRKERFIWGHKSRGELRWWLHIGRHTFHAQLARPKFSMSFGLSTDGEHTISGDFCGFFWHFEGYPLAQLIRKIVGKSIDNSFRFYWYHWGLWFSLWGNDFESSSSDPWWRKTYHLNIPDLVLGKSKYSSEDLETFHDVIIPMPERNYLAVMTFVRSTWQRPRWKAVVRNFTRVELDRDAPKFPGKGENSWDQGDDCIWGMSTEGHSLAKAVGGYVSSCLEYREKRSGREGFFANPVIKVE